MEAELLQTVEQLLEQVQSLSLVAATVITAMQRGDRLSDAALADYAAQLAQVEEQRARRWDSVRSLWQMIGSDRPH